MKYREISAALSASITASLETIEKVGMMTDEEAQTLYGKLDFVVRLGNQALEAIEMREAT